MRKERQPVGRGRELIGAAWLFDQPESDEEPDAGRDLARKLPHDRCAFRRPELDQLHPGVPPAAPKDRPPGRAGVPHPIQLSERKQIPAAIYCVRRHHRRAYLPRSPARNADHMKREEGNSEPLQSDDHTRQRSHPARKLGRRWLSQPEVFQ